MKSLANCRTIATALWVLVLCILDTAGTFAAGGALPPIAFGAGDRAAARLGVAAAAVGELLDAPPLLASADGQRFIRDAFARFPAALSNDALRARFAHVRKELAPRDTPLDRTRALEDYRDLLSRAIEALPAVSRRAFLVGDLAQSIAYNARVLREPDADRFRATLAGLGDADAAAPGLADFRAQLGKLEAEDWAASGRLGTAAVAAIVGPDAVPFPAAPSIWTILVRSSVAAGRSAPHLALDVVWFDGHHQTFAAYPDGDDFGKNADRLVCTRGHEGALRTLHATPLSVPRERGYDALAASFEASCDAFDAAPPPYVVADAGDDRFVAALLTAAGLDPKRALGERAK